MKRAMLSIKAMEGRQRENLFDEFYNQNRSYFIPSLPQDTCALPWRTFVADLHRANVKGQGQTIAVIDSGFDTKHPILTQAASGCHDLTGEGIEDNTGHGTLVSLLCLAVAPEAKLLPIKIFGKNGACAGGAQQSSVMAQAIRQAGELGASVINISAGRYREGHKAAIFLDGKYLTNVCNCEICFAAEETALQFNSAVFVAAGNTARFPLKWLIRMLWASHLPTTARALEKKQMLKALRSCPASAAEVTPVMGVVNGKALATIPHSEEHIVHAVGAIMGKYGSSFATPLVSGTAALLTQASSIRPSNLPKFAPYKVGRPGGLFRRNFRDAAFYQFNLQSIFLQPDDPDPLTALNLAAIYRVIDMPEKAETLLLQAFRLHTQQGDRDNAKKIYDSLQEMYTATSNWQKVTQLEAAWFDFILRTQSSEELKETAETFNQLGLHLQQQNKFTDAKLAFCRCVIFLKKALGPIDNIVGQRSLNLAGCSLADNDPKTAEAAIRDALTVFGSRETRELAITMDYLGCLNRGYRRIQEAEQCFQRAIGIFENLGLKTDAAAAVTLRNYAELLLDLNRGGEAGTLLTRAREIERGSKE